MRVFLAGGSGVLGRQLIPMLTSAGHQVTAMTRSAVKTDLMLALGATPVVADALDHDAVVRAVVEARPDVVMNFHTDLGSGTLASNAQIRTAGADNILKAAHEASVSKIVAESISWVYAPRTEIAVETNSLDETVAEPRRTTIEGVRALESSVPAGSIVLRFGQLYGPETWYSRDGRFGLAARAGGLAATETVTSFIHVSDAARAAVQALDWPGGIYNVVDDEPASGHDWAPVFAAAVGAPDPVNSVSADPGRPVSNARAHDRGLTLRYPSWREGFRSL